MSTFKKVCAIVWDDIQPVLLFIGILGTIAFMMAMFTFHPFATAIGTLVLIVVLWIVSIVQRLHS